MKKILSLLSLVLSAALISSVFIGCSTVKEGDYHLSVPDGAPLLAIADMWNESDSFAPAKLSYEITAEANLSQKFTEAEDEVILAPVNVGAGFHNSFVAGNARADYKLLNVISWGVIYFTSNEEGYKTREECSSLDEFLSQFSGKTIKTIGLAAIPGKTVDYIFKSRNINVVLSGSDATTIQQSFVKGDPTTAIFAQPAITGTQTKGTVNVLGSVSSVYTEITGKDFPMAGTFVRADELEKNRGFFDKLNDKIKTSVENFNADPEAVGAKAEAAGSSLKAAVIKKAADKMNVKFKNSKDSKDSVKALLTNIGVNVNDSFFA